MLKHLAIIPDGNRRYARDRGMKVWNGHREGINNLEKLMTFAFKELKIPVITIYSFSLQNFKRSEEEVNMLMDFFADVFERFATSKEIHENGVRVRAIGRLNMLPENVKNAIKNAEKATKNHKNHHLNLAIAYDGQAELVDAVKKLVRSKKPINEANIRQALYLGDLPAPDLIIRTSGEQRVSGFLLWDSSYSEFLFRKEYWPEYTVEMLRKDVKQFEERERRFGK